MRVIPAILTYTEDEFKAKIDKVRPLEAMVQIDVMDGVFVNNSTWADVEKIPAILDGLPFEAHLMVTSPEEHVRKWLDLGAERVYFHIESTDEPQSVLKAAGADVHRLGVAINPDTDLRHIEPLLSDVRQVLVMGVQPGWSGQDFDEGALLHLQNLRTLDQGLSLSVDGGVNMDTVGSIQEAGADDIVSGSALSDAKNIHEAYSELAAA